MLKKPLFIIIGGAYGVGKTTIAHQLSFDLHIPQRVALSGITKSIKALLPRSAAARNWDKFELTPASIEQKLEREARLVGKVVAELVRSAQKDCKNHILDGVQLLPEYLPCDQIIYVLITASDQARHRKRFEHPTITKTCRSEDTPFARAELVNQILIERWRPYNVPVIDNLISPEDSSRQIVDYIKRLFPDYAERFMWLEDEKARVRPVDA